MLATTAFLASAQFEVEYEGGVTANYGKGDIAPYYINSNRGGTLTQQYSTLLNAAAKHELDTTRRFSFGFGAEFWGGYTSSVSYDRYDLATGKFVRNLQHPAHAWVQQLYADVKYRSLFATVGAKARQSDLASADLSSGDLVMSGNARPGTGIRAGLVNYQNIPFTNGWVQISGEIGYERLDDGDWLKNHYNYYNNFQYCGYAHHGMAMGSPMLKSPLYNTDGYMSFTDTRVQGFHIGVRGHFSDRIEYRALMSYRRALGNYNSPRIEVAHDTSAMLEGVYRAASVEGLQLKCQLAIDRGTLYSNNFGALISVSYTGNLSF